MAQTAEQSGSLHLGDTLGAIFFGITTMQTYIYYKRSENDPLVMTGLYDLMAHEHRLHTFGEFLSAKMILDILHTIMITHSVYTYAVVNFAHPDALSKEIWFILMRIHKSAYLDVSIDQLIIGLIAFALALGFQLENNPVSSTIDRFSALTTRIIKSLIYASLSPDAFNGIMISAVLL
ncbi:hypothetical protein WOLCODRAFT_21402 [Wolfiporia cocos MD-104 SS10]|uniref:Uncharacterized protein n=1 Tax=Wolfiporia cocos (strain MD-104) TaxID=742152 RepID=A0A2H3JAJ0_WOLCO|nr:hypothetical protein WOLCODRAFT_21402 [Wolfiporia cocos MD-104 SS10]